MNASSVTGAPCACVNPRCIQGEDRTLPKEIRPEAYEQLLEEIGVRSRPERELLSEIVKNEIGSAHLAVTRAKLNHFLWWLGGQQ